MSGFLQFQIKFGSQGTVCRNLRPEVSRDLGTPSAAQARVRQTCKWNFGATALPAGGLYQEADGSEEQAMKVKNSMHKGVEWMSPDTPVKTLAKAMLEHDIGAIPIGENDRLVGMVTDRDITVRAVANGKDISALTARDVMTKGIVWCRDNDDVTHAANVMQSKQIRRLPVIDKDKRMVGIMSLGDLSHAATERTAAAVTKGVSAHHD